VIAAAQRSRQTILVTFGFLQYLNLVWPLVTNSYHGLASKDKVPWHLTVNAVNHRGHLRPICD